MQKDKPKKSRLCRTDCAVGSVTLASTLVACLWPPLDFVYKHSFSRPAMWWVSLLVALAGWITLLLTANQRAGESRLMERLDTIEATIEHYGNNQDSPMHTATASANGGHGAGVVRLVSPLE